MFECMVSNLCFKRIIIGPVSVKTGVIDMEMKIQMTALRESIHFLNVSLKFERITIIYY